MADDFVLVHRRRLDAKVDRITDDLADVRIRLTNLEDGQAVLSRRMDRPEARVERRLDPVDMPH